MNTEPRSLELAPTEPRGRAQLERPGIFHTGYNEQEASEQTVPLTHYLWMFRRHKWRLLLLIVVSVTATIYVSSRLTPYYESTATIDVDRMVPTGVIGAEANAARNSNAYDSDAFLETQMKLIQADSVVRPVVQKLKIPPSEIGLPPDATSKSSETPIALKYLTVRRPVKTYLLEISYRSPDPDMAADVANSIAESYIAHSYSIKYQASAGLSSFVTKQLEELQAKMEKSTAALAQAQKELNVISPDEKTNILSARLLQLNTEYTSAQADRFKKEAVLKSVKSGALEALESSAQGEQIRKLIEHINEEDQKFTAIKSHLGPNHPEYKKALANEAELKGQLEKLRTDIAKGSEVEFRDADNREQMVRKAVEETKAELDGQNLKTMAYINLKRDADADRALYEELTRKIKEAGINASFQNSSIRLADRARPGLRPVFPRTTTNAMIAFLLSTFLGIGAVIISESLDRTIRDPEQIQRQMHTEFLGSLPVVKAWRGRLPANSDRSGGGDFFALGEGNSSSYEEAVRTLRDSILLPSANNRPRTMLVTSAAPREGKTTTAVHLAVVHSQQKRKTLLIDCDLRRPSIYTHVGVTNDSGLSNVINDGLAWRDLVQNCPGLSHLDTLPAGPPSRRAADALGTTLVALLEDALKDYDLVICDAPPLLGFAETLQIAALVDGVVVMALAGQTERQAVSSVLSNLKRLNANVIGVALNEVRADMGERYYYYGHYGKNYSRYYKTLPS